MFMRDGSGVRVIDLNNLDLTAMVALEILVSRDSMRAVVSGHHDT
jgi:hypothetical protein